MDAPPTRRPDAGTLRRLAAIVGDRYALTGEAMGPYLVEWRDRFLGKAAMVLRPGSTEEVARILALANAGRVGIVPQGGNTGLVGGQIPSASGDEVVVSLGRLDRILSVDGDGNTLAAEAGCTLAQVQAAARAHNRLFPLSLGAEGTCQIGGNLATNAGGVAVLSYGTARDLALGLEVVLADGRVWDGMRALRKDNTGYDLKHLFIGGEGTLGIITKAVVKLFPAPVSRETAFVGLARPADAVALLRRAQAAFGRDLTSCELMPRIGIEFLLRHLPEARDPMDGPWPWYILLEISGGAPRAMVRPRFEAMLSGALEDGEAGEVVIAASTAQADALWRMRGALSEVQKHEGGSIKHDISVPVAAIPAFLDAAAKLVGDLVPGARPVPFGHLGDGNLHYNVSQPEDMEREAFLALWEQLNARVHDLVARHRGSISAEHGIGVLKRDALPGVKSAVEMELMRALKRALDPNGILNPGKLL